MEERESSQLGAFAIVGTSVAVAEKGGSVIQADKTPIPRTTPSRLRRKEALFVIVWSSSQT